MNEHVSNHSRIITYGSAYQTTIHAFLSLKSFQQTTFVDINLFYLYIYLYKIYTPCAYCSYVTNKTFEKSQINTNYILTPLNLN